MSGERVAVVSQESSALWVGRLSPSTWEVVDDGVVYLFPRTRHGQIRYGTVEGVSWLDEQTLAVVSDRAKPGQPRRMRATDQSVHIVALPVTDTAGGAGLNTGRSRRDRQGCDGACGGRHRVTAPACPFPAAGDRATTPCSRSPGCDSSSSAWPPRSTADRRHELEHTLGFVPPDTRLPMVHLSRGIDLLRDERPRGGDRRCAPIR